MASANRSAYLLLAFVATLQLWPYVAFNIGGDKYAYLLYLECFAQSLLEGELRPTWCRFADWGFGNTIFYLYFPLPYYFASLFYPLKSVGVGVEHILTLQMLLANMLFAFTLFYWIKRHTTRQMALLITCLLMFVPYRLELLFFRFAHAEVIAIAMLPLWLIGVEKMMEARKNWHFLALIAGLSALIHAQMALIFGIISLLYALFYTKNIRSVVWMGFACAFGIVLAAYFIVPAAYYQQFILGADGGTNYEHASPNRYPVAGDFTAMRGRLLVLSFCALLAVLGLWLATAKQTANKHLRRFTRSWMLTFVVCALLYSPLIAPIFDNSALLRSIFFPWRMQVVFVPVLAVLLVAFFTREKRGNRKKTMAADMCVLFLFLNLLQLFSLQIMEDGQEHVTKTISRDLVMPIGEYLSVWTPTDRMKVLMEPHKSVITQGSGSIESIEAHGNMVQIKAKLDTPSVIKLHQAYFPSWVASMDGSAVALTPDETLGATLVDVPMAGDVTVLLENKPYAAAPIYVRLSPWVSLGALLFLLYSWRRRASNT